MTSARTKLRAPEVQVRTSNSGNPPSRDLPTSGVADQTTWFNAQVDEARWALRRAADAARPPEHVAAAANIAARIATQGRAERELAQLEVETLRLAKQMQLLRVLQAESFANQAGINFESAYIKLFPKETVPCLK